MKLFKRFVAMLIVIIMIVSTGVCDMTVSANEPENKVYGPKNIENAKLTLKDIPDILV